MNRQLTGKPCEHYRDRKVIRAITSPFPIIGYRCGRCHATWPAGAATVEPEEVIEQEQEEQYVPIRDPYPISVRIEPNRGTEGVRWHLRTDYALSDRSGWSTTPVDALHDVADVLKGES